MSSGGLGVPDVKADDILKAFPQYLKMDDFLAANPDDAKGFAEVGAHYLLQGDRATNTFAGSDFALLDLGLDFAS